MLPEIIITLVADFKEVLNLLYCLHIEYMIQWGAVKSGHYLKLGLLITLGPLEVSLRIGECWGEKRSVDDVLEPFVFEHQGNYLAPLGVVVTIVVKWL